MQGRRIVKLSVSITLLCSLLVITLYFLYFNKGRPSPNTKSKVYISGNKGNYTLYKNGKPFVIKGATGQTHLNRLQQCGGNTIRIYDTVNLAAILDTAAANDIAVIIGLTMPHNVPDFFYHDKPKVAAQFTAYKSVVEKYKNHPAVLMWCIGNELDFTNKPGHRDFYNAYNNLVSMIHASDPDHPVTTTVNNYSRTMVFAINTRTETDVISLNIFGSLFDLKEKLNSYTWLWDGPFIIMEWGIEGPWPINEQTAWGSYIEATSTKKAEQYLQVYRDYMPVENKRFLGSLVFYWGQKQETTHTWFSLFDKEGAASEAVGTMQYIWTGKNTQAKPPQVSYMLVDNKGARGNIMFKPGETKQAAITMLNKDSSYKTIRWEMYPEDWYKKNNVNNTIQPDSVQGLFVAGSHLSATFRTPSKEGPYRIFAILHDAHGNYTSCNTPFYVLK